MLSFSLVYLVSSASCVLHPVSCILWMLTPLLAFASACVYVCVRSVYVSVCLCVCVCARASARVYAHVCACVLLCEKENTRACI